jgi:CheY-like chemotaxis protein
MLALRSLISSPQHKRQKELPTRANCLGRVLLVDDDQTGLFLRAQVLERAGYAVTLRVDPRHALQCDMRSFDLAIIDFEMPGCDGRELLLRMRSLKAGFPILLLSGSVDKLPPETRILFSRCIAKPLCPDALLEAVRGFLDEGILPDSC